MIIQAIILPVSAYIAYSILKRKSFEKVRDRIPVRIHIGGTRGKSTVVKLILGGLWEAGKSASGKVTGETPTYLDTKGNEASLKRKYPIDIIEQRDVIKLMASQNTEYGVIENMAINPELIEASESQIIRSHIGVLTNVRQDHNDLWGIDPVKIAEIHAKGLPENGVAFTGESDYLSTIEELCKKKNTQVYYVPESDWELSDTSSDIEKVNQHNLALALKVCIHLGISEDVARKGILKILSRIPPFYYEWNGYRFYSFFNVNDHISAGKIFSKISKKSDIKKIAVFNHRYDRPWRWDNFQKFLSRNFEAIILIGDSLPVGKRMSHSMIDLSKCDIFEDIKEELLNRFEFGTEFWCWGNSKGIEIK